MGGMVACWHDRAQVLGGAAWLSALLQSIEYQQRSEVEAAPDEVFRIVRQVHQREVSLWYANFRHLFFLNPLVSVRMVMLNLFIHAWL